MTTDRLSAKFSKLAAEIQTEQPKQEWQIALTEMIDDHKMVDSSMVRSVGYQHKYHVLNVVYHQGGNWLYADVPVEIYEVLLISASIGKAVNTFVKGKYEALRLDNG